ncbi:MAG: TVP38/TMEM64 family protein [Betaproteobacteria bacterium]
MSEPNAPATGGIPWRKLALAAVLASVVIAFFALGGPRHLSLDTVKANRDALVEFTNRHYVAALAIAFAVYASAVAFSLPAGLVLSLTMGFLFGRWVGTALVVIAATIGATFVFIAARYLFADAARQRMGKLGAKIITGFAENALNYLLFLRLVPLFPFFLVNLAPAFTSISVRTFALGTLIGIIPGTFVIVNLGQALGRIDSLSGLLSTETLGAFVLLGVLALVPVLVRKFRSSPVEKA